MKTVETIYLGGLRTKALHVRSGNILITDAPVDNQGKGEYFSPTDLLATALGSCILTTIEIASMKENLNLNINDTTISITKRMADNPRRIREIVCEINFPKNDFTELQKKQIEVIARGCPVARSLHPDLVQTMIFNF
jgi:putative redox protein